MEDKIPNGRLELGSILTLHFPRLVVFGVFPTPVELINFSLSLGFDLQKAIVGYSINSQNEAI